MTKKYIKNCTGEQCEEEKADPNIASRIVFHALSVCFICVSGYTLFFSEHLKVTNIEITGNNEIGKQEIQQEIENLLQGSLMGVIPKNNFLFISHKKIEQVLTDDFKKIRTVEVTKKFPDTVNIVIDERKALLVWCFADKCYLLDEEGYAYSVADFSSPELTQNHLLQINDESGREVSIGTKVIEPAYEQYVLSVKDALAAAGFNVTDQYWTPSRMAEEINVKTDQDLEFYFSTQFDLKSALKTLTTILKKEIPEEKRTEVAYFDLRNENKAFYKFKNVEPAPNESLIENAEEKKQ